MTGHPPGTPRASIYRALVVAGLLLAVSFALRLLSPDYLQPELARRVPGVLTGMVVVVYANAAPKALAPLTRMRCDPVAEQAVRRFTGWSLALGGAAYALAWAAAPLEHASVLSASLLGTALLLAVARCGWGMAAGSRA